MPIHEIAKGGREVSQLTLEKFIALKNAMNRAKVQFDSISREVLSDLLDGAQVEYGVHGATVDVKTRGGKLVQKLKVS